MLSLKLNKQPEIVDVIISHFHVEPEYINENTSLDENLYIYKIGETIVKITNGTYASQRLNKELEYYSHLYSVLSDDEMKYFIPNVTGSSFVYGDYVYTYLQMPYITGIELFDYFKSNPDKKQLYKVLKEIAIGLLILSKHGLSHGDMHNGNVFVINDTVKIIDFDKADKSSEMYNSGPRFNPLRNRNFLKQHSGDQTGFFNMCAYLLTDSNLKQNVEKIRIKYISNGISSDVNVQEAFESFIALMDDQKGGRMKKKRKTRRLT